ncbi:hypothetical protein IJ732_03530 [bacterium]|nr:hypothetical protein [bacterium]
MQVQRCEYLIQTNSNKKNGQKLNNSDYMNIGYMAGRYGINLDGNLNQNFKPVQTENGLLINVNTCTADLLEDNLNKAGIKFQAIA